MSLEPQSPSRRADGELSATAVSGEELRLVAYLRGQNHHIHCGRDVYGAAQSLLAEDELGVEQLSKGAIDTHPSESWTMLVPLRKFMPEYVDLAGNASGRGGTC